MDISFILGGGGALTIQRKSFKILGLCMAYMAFKQMGSLSCLTCCDTRPQVLSFIYVSSEDDNEQVQREYVDKITSNYYNNPYLNII